MNKISKSLITVTCVAVLGTGAVFAQNKNGMHKNGMNMNQNRDLRQPLEMPADENMPAPKHAEFIGTVSAIDESKGKITIADLDGKETTVLVNPFTHICVDFSREPKSISDLKKGDWIMYSLYNTETENKLASRIFVRNNK